MKFTKHPLPPPSHLRLITREEELILINQAIDTPKYRKISSEEYLEKFFSDMNKKSKESRNRIIKTNNRGVAQRSNNMRNKD